MDLENFEDYFPRKLLIDGKGLFEQGLVQNLEELYGASWAWHASVKIGRNFHPVAIYLEDDGEIIDYECNCSNFSLFGFCPHVAAILYAVNAQLDDEGDVSLEQLVPPLIRDVEERLQDFEKLAEVPKRLLKIAALAWNPASQTKLIQVFNESGFRHEGKQLNHKAIKPIIKKLHQQGWLNQTERKQYQCVPALAQLICDRYFDKDPDFNSLHRPVLRNFTSQSGWYHYFDPEQVFMEMRIARYTKNTEQFKKHFLALVNSNSTIFTPDLLTEFWLGEGFDREKLMILPAGIQAFFLSIRLNRCIFYLEPAKSPYTAFTRENISTFSSSDRTNLAFQLALLDFFCDDWAAIQKLSSTITLELTSMQGIKKVLQGDHQSAINTFDQAQKTLRKETGQRGNYLAGIPGIFHILARLQSREVKWYGTIRSHIKYLNKYQHPYYQVYALLDAVVSFLENERSTAQQWLDRTVEVPLFSFFHAFCQFWVDRNKLDTQFLITFHEKLSADGYHWLAAELKAMLEELGLEQKVEGPLPQGVPLARLLPYIEEWENALRMLAQIGGKKKAQENSKYRIAWLVDFEHHQVQARLQTLNKQGWTKGRKVAYDRLNREKVSGMTEQDKRFINSLVYAWGSEISLNGDPGKWKHLVGHPLLFLQKSPKTAVQLVAAKPNLIATKTDSGYQLRFSHDIISGGAQIIKESPTRYLFIEVTDQLLKIAQAFNGRSLSVPERAESQLREILGSLSTLVEVQSAFENEQLPSVPSDNTIWVHLLPIGDGFHVELYVKPFQDSPPYVKPGEGEAFLIGTPNGERTSTTRDLKAEIKNATALRKAVPTLDNKKPKNQIWQLEDGETCLQLLLELQPLLAEGTIRLEWPKGEKFRIDSVVGFDEFRLSVRDGRQWFELEGEIRVDEKQVLNLQELLKFSEQQSQFVEVSPGKFLAFTKAFREKLKSINSLLSSPKKGGALLLHPLATPAIEAFTSALSHLEVSPKFADQQQRIKKAFGKTYKLSKNFKATLRPYQQDGFQWLHRCAAWGVGACLADDMGLGKTVQALAFLTDRAKLGPALVVAPASVCRNWAKESERFAPKLKPVLFGEGDREAMLKEAGKGTLVIVTYDLMSREEALFKEKEWATVILDEAQAIKNRATKRSETAMSLKADFRMAMTGTPIENHLGELWNLFQFLNPGLLGSIDQFNERFAIPIEKYKAENKREQLRKLVQPFILRRRKDEVLKDLPEKTEITLSVELSPKERAFYEALRRNALDKLAETEGQQAGQQHLRILAEIVRLRRAACHPDLVDPKAGFKESAKLSLFAEVLEELLDGGHKALVFSQFVGHLKILENYLKQQKISYQYLDGSTSGKKRQAAIDAFQAGEGEVFLISLKAGGTGLNLTAADYVIHTDPWWNPAVEDQATDRAHRIGQERPVTVYRLIAEQTIEEKILRLHAQKRDLADSLLAGTDVSAKMTADDLMQLLKEA